MPIVINGSGTVTGISAGGLPDDCITTAEIAANAVTTAKLGTNEASGLCKAWVNFNGTGAVAIRASYNVSSITDIGVGLYTVNFTTAMVDADYSGAASVQSWTASLYGSTASAQNVATFNTTNVVAYDDTTIRVAIFR